MSEEFNDAELDYLDQEDRFLPAPKPVKYKKSIPDHIFVVCNWIFMICFVVITIYPILNTLAISFNDGIDAVRGGIHIFPRKFSLNNYSVVFKQQNLKTGLFISVMRTVIGTALGVVANAILAFLVSRKRFLLKKPLTVFWVITMYVNGGMIPVLILFKNLKLTGTFWVYVIPGMLAAFNMLVMRTFMEGIPDSLEEAAQIDGASYGTIFIKVLSPLCKPMYATIALFIAVGQWNSWFDTMLYNRISKQYTTLQYELMKLLASVSSQSSKTDPNSTEGANLTPVAVRSAATIVTMAPIVCLYPFLQRYFVTGLTIGGVKE
ncbi:MAG: carbohydrate ABC transporter permease [Eubacterium sp.]|nr:carbohydrate ABC transporter permease [Eubacterium sp.]